MNTQTKGLLVFIAVIIVAFMIGSYVLTAAFFGVVLLIGLIFLVESIQPLKWLVSKSSKVIDILIFIFSIVAMGSLGLNITAALSIAGLGFTLVYAPYLRAKTQEQETAHKQYINKSRARERQVNRM